MLLSIYNLPLNINYNYIKQLLYDKCGITDVIIDKLVPDGEGSKVTVGLADEEDAAILVRKINGLYICGQQLYVEDVRKKKASDQPYRTTPKTQQTEYAFQNMQPQSYSHSNPSMSNQGGVPMMMPTFDMSGGLYYVPTVPAAPSLPTTPLMSYNTQYQAMAQYPGVSGQQKQSFNAEPAERNANGGSGRAQNVSWHINAPVAPNSETNYRPPFHGGNQPKAGQKRKSRDSRWAAEPVHDEPQPREASPPRESWTNRPQAQYEPTDTYSRDDSGYRQQESSPRSAPLHFDLRDAYKDGPNRYNANRFDDRQKSGDSFAPPRSCNANATSENRFQPKRGKFEKRGEFAAVPVRADAPTRPPHERPSVRGPAPKVRDERRNTQRNRSGSYRPPDRPETSNFFEPRNRSPDFNSSREPRAYDANIFFEPRNRSPDFNSSREPRAYDRKTFVGGNDSKFKGSASNETRLQQPTKPAASDRRSANASQRREPGPSGGRADGTRGVKRPHSDTSNYNEPAPKMFSNMKREFPNRTQSTNAEHPPGNVKYPIYKVNLGNYGQVLKRDQTWRSMATARIAKAMMATCGNRYLSAELFAKVIRQLKTCIKTRIDVVLGPNMCVPVDEIEQRYRLKFLPYDDPEFFEAVYMKVVSDGNESEGSASPDAEPVSDVQGPTGTQQSATEDDGGTVPATSGQTCQPKVDIELPKFKAAEGAVPKYPMADKAVYKVQKKLQNLEKLHNLYELEPKMKKPYEEEMEAIMDIFRGVVATPDDECEREICEKIAAGVGGQFKSYVGTMISKRLLNVHTGLLVRIHGIPKLPRKETLANFLKGYGVVSLKKSDRKMLYIANVDTYENYDKLLALGSTILDDMTVSIKTLHMLDKDRKIPRALQLENICKYIKNTQPATSVEPATDESLEMSNKSEVKKEVVKQESSCQEITEDVELSAVPPKTEPEQCAELPEKQSMEQEPLVLKKEEEQSDVTTVVKEISEQEIKQTDVASVKEKPKQELPTETPKKGEVESEVTSVPEEIPTQEEEVRPDITQVMEDIPKEDKGRTDLTLVEELTEQELLEDNETQESEIMEGLDSEIINLTNIDEDDLEDY